MRHDNETQCEIVDNILEQTRKNINVEIGEIRKNSIV